MTHRFHIAATLLLVYASVFALPEAPVSHSVSPELNGLNINYLTKTDRIKISLYVVNHEPFPVLCDAQYQSGPDKQEVIEKTIPGQGKADSFKVHYGRRSESIILRLQCIKSPD